MMSELEQDAAAEVEGLSSTAQESLIKSVSGEEKCLKKRRANFSLMGKTTWGLHEIPAPH